MNTTLKIACHFSLCHGTKEHLLVNMNHTMRRVTLCLIGNNFLQRLDVLDVGIGLNKDHIHEVPPKGGRSERRRSNVFKTDHCVFTYFQKDPNCETCKMRRPASSNRV